MKVYNEELEILILKGSDVIDFLQRISTNDFRNFHDNSVLRTVLTNEKGRIVDFITVLKYQSEIVVITSNEREKIVTDFLNKYIVTEDIEITISKSKKYTLIPEFEHDFEFLSGCNKFEGNYLFLDDYSFKKLIIISLNEKSDFKNAILENCEYISYAFFKQFSINAGYLFESNELNEDINPLECGLKEYISFNKGCYIGQEVIARMDSQNKVPKSMVKIKSNYPLTIGSKIYKNEDGNCYECGFITSSLKITESFIGLGFSREIESNENCNYYINNDINNVILINKFKY